VGVTTRLEKSLYNMEVSCRSEEVVEDSRMVAVVREESPADFLHGHAQCELSRAISKSGVEGNGYAAQKQSIF
jgi:hypothetical protein